MADNNIRLDDIGDAGRRARSEFEDIRNLVEALNSQLSAANQLTSDFAGELSRSATQSRRLADEAEKVRGGSASTKRLLNQQAEAIAKQRTLQQQANEALQKSVSARNTEQRILIAQANKLAQAASEAGMLANNFRELANINAELDKKAEFFSNLGKLSGQIPGLEKFSSIFSDIGQSIRNSAREGKEGWAKFAGVIDVLGRAALAAFIKQLFAVDQETTQLARNLNLSKAEAIELKQQFAGVARNSGDIAINSVRIAKANTELNAQLGTAIIFSSDLTVTFSKLTEIVGLSAEAAASLAFQAQRAGETLRETEENALGSSYALQRTRGIALNNKEILEATGKVTGQVRANLGANPEAIARAVTEAKLFGAELEDMLQISNSLLDFESSIGNELKAELITGRQINLERARSLALVGDQESLTREIAAQAGTFTEFNKLNVLQQRELAEAFGLSADRLSDILFKQEIQGMNARQLRALGKGELANRLEQLSAQEQLQLATEKFMTALGDLATVLMPIVDGFSSIVKFLAESKAASSIFVGIMGALAIRSIVSAVAQIFAASFTLGPLGIGLAAAGVAALYASIAKAPRMAEGGIVKAKPGGSMIIAGEAGRDEAIIPLNRLNNNPPPQQPAPIIIENRWSAWGASNGNGRQGLGGTQNLQASPTFA